jgi:hypothetical protein
MTEINPRIRALEDIVMIARQHGLSVSEVAAALGAPPPRTASASRARSNGWLPALIVFGLVMVGVSALAFRIDRD